MNRLFSLSLYASLSVFTIAFTGCRTIRMVDFPQSDFVTGSGNTPALEDVQKAIINGGTKLGWTFSKAGEGKLLATLNVRRHQVRGDLTFTTSSYKFTYKDSKSMMYNGKVIHKKYSSWIRNLKKYINKELSTL